MNKYQSIFENIVNDPDYLENLDWGKPRPGHPEGTAKAHITDLENNLDAFKGDLTEDQFWKLKILIHVHDSFKAESQKKVPISHPKSHASLARVFLQRHCSESDLAQMVQLHDEPYALWRQLRHKGHFSQERLERLVATIEDWSLFVRFLLIDGFTAGKDRSPLQWVLAELAPRVGCSKEGAAWLDCLE